MSGSYEWDVEYGMLHMLWRHVKCHTSAYEWDVEYGILNMSWRDVKCRTGMLHMGC